MANTSGQLVELIREVVKEEISKKDSSSICLIDSINSNSTVNIKLLSDDTVVKNIPNTSGYTMDSGDLAVIYKLGNSLNNSFVFSKVTNDSLAKSLSSQLSSGQSNTGYSTAGVTSIGGVQGDILLGNNLSMTGNTLNATGGGSSELNIKKASLLDSISSAKYNNDSGFSFQGRTLIETIDGTKKNIDTSVNLPMYAGDGIYMVADSSEPTKVQIAAEISHKYIDSTLWLLNSGSSTTNIDEADDKNNIKGD